MLNLNNIHNEFVGNLSQQIDWFLGTLHHEQIVLLSYMLSALSLSCLIGHIFRKALSQKKILQQLNKKELFGKEKYNEKHSSKT
ncbi:heme exporter protein CcmD [Bartonella rattaustraliani]|uniref:heme exporter protein CcmD n=1 Tax=Bartonella rattaustraliani TaxID=481139 RepID=UPI0003623525|nr:heme exporter protein CcmD [Bartonella rattaustraliani]